ncbi:MAG: oxidoreductase [Pseudomonadota bacterium]
MVDDPDSELFAGLQEVGAGAFPKVCPNCGRTYENLAQFLELTVPAGGHSGLKSALDDDDRPVVELFRNCVCGSTLMDFCRSRRDESQDGLRRRATFNRMLDVLVRRGMAWEVAHRELLKLTRGERSKMIDSLLRAAN